MREFPTDVAAQLSALPHLSAYKLRSLWAAHFDGPPRFQAQKGLLMLILAYHLQEKAYGGLNRTSQKRLHKLAEAVGKPSSSPNRTAVRPKPGTRLIREWKGDTHVVSVLDNGVEYRGKRYRSLTEVAGVISGTHWSGPVFFGLRTPKPARRAQESQ